MKMPLVSAGDQVRIETFSEQLRFESACGVTPVADQVLRLVLSEESRVRFTTPSRQDTYYSLRRGCARIDT